MEIDDKLKALIKELGSAINHAISNSDTIGKSIEKIKTNGYDLFLILEATVGLQKKGAKKGKLSAVMQKVHPDKDEVNFVFSSNDRDFLRSMKIRVDETEEEEPGGS